MSQSIRMKKMTQSSQHRMYPYNSHSSITCKPPCLGTLRTDTKDTDSTCLRILYTNTDVYKVTIACTLGSLYTPYTSSPLWSHFCPSGGGGDPRCSKRLCRRLRYPHTLLCYPYSAHKPAVGCA